MSNNIQSYLQTLEEQAMVVGARKPGDLDGAKKATIAPLSTDSIDGVDNEIEEPEHLQGTTTNEEGVQYINMNKNNAFEDLYRRAIQEDFDESPEGGDASFGGGMGDAGDGLGGDDMGGDDEFGGDDESPDYDAEGHVGKVREAVQLLQQALDILSQFEGEEEEEYEEYENEEGGEDDFGGEEAPVTEEETQFGQAKTVGHALVNRNSFDKGQTKKGNMLVKGAAPKVSSKKASPQYGKGINGKLSNFSDSGSKKMQSKGNMKVPGRASNTGKFAFED